MISLCPDKSQSIIGPFEFEKIDAYNITRQNIPADCWKKLYEECIRYGMIPQRFGNNSSQLPPIQYDGCKKQKLDKIG